MQQSNSLLRSDANPLRDAISWLRGIKHPGDNEMNLGLTIEHLQNILARCEAEEPNQCYCACTDGDPKACAGWQGWQDEPPCRCACH